LGIDTALVAATDHADVTLLTPRGTPGVLDNPVVLASIGTITNGEDTVVEVGAAGAVKDTRGVELEALLVGLNGNGDGLCANSGEESRLAVGLDVLVAGEGDNGRASLASAITSSVGVGSLGADTMVVHDPLEGTVHETTTAAVVTGGASTVNKLLLRDVGERALLDGPSTLNGTSGGEGPAGTALALVLDGGDSTIVAPVPGIVGRDRVDLSDVQAACIVRLDIAESEHGRAELLGGQITHFIHRHGVRGGSTVVGQDEVEVCFKNIVAEEEGIGGIGLAILIDKTGEEELVLGS